jgi:hypothetical protein
VCSSLICGYHASARQRYSEGESTFFSAFAVVTVRDRSGPMGDQHEAIWADTTPRRPALDPSIPRPDRDLLAARGALVTPVGQDRLARRRYYLPTEPAQRLATIDGTVTGLTAAGLTVLFGTTPLAIGVLIFGVPAGWETVSNRFALLLAGLITVITTVILGIRIVRFGQPSGRAPAETAARYYHGRYITSADLDGQSGVLLRRAQDAIDAVTPSLMCRDDLLDQHATCTALASQEWDIAVALREQAQLRARRAELSASGAGPQTAAVLNRQGHVAQLAEASITRRVEALERYAAEVGAADSAYRDARHAVALAHLHDQHLDMLARTAADEHGIAEIGRLSEQARTVRRALRQPPG